MRVFIFRDLISIEAIFRFKPDFGDNAVVIMISYAEVCMIKGLLFAIDFPFTLTLSGNYYFRTVVGLMIMMM